MTLEDWQRDIDNEGGDRHAIIVQPAGGDLWEMWRARLSGTAWEAACGAKFNLGSNSLRPMFWTSGDAAGLPMFPALVRYDECLRGKVEHALRLIVPQTRRAFIYPATHYASSSTNPNRPAMGQRFRLKSAFVVPESWTSHEKAVCYALKKYGALIADSGNFFSISISPDPRFPDNAFQQLRTIDVSEFEVIATTGPNEGPRSPNPPGVNAGPDQIVAAAKAACLDGSVNALPGAMIHWTKYSGPGSVAFANASAPATCATFAADGTYTLVLSADDTLHTPAYDAVVIHVGFQLEIAVGAGAVILRFPAESGRQYQIEESSDLGPAGWTARGDVLTGTGEIVAVFQPAPPEAKAEILPRASAVIGFATALRTRGNASLPMFNEFMVGTSFHSSAFVHSIHCGQRGSASRISAAPKYGWSGSGIATEPSGCWPDSRRATKRRARAVPEPLRVWQRRFFPVAGSLNLSAMRRAW